MKHQPLQKILLTALLAALSIIFLFPFFIMLMTSLKSPYELQQSTFTFFPVQPTLANYVESMQVGDWSRYFLNTAVVTAVTVLVSLVLNSMAAYAFSRLRFPLRDFLFSFSLIAMLIPEQVIMIPVFLRLKTIPFMGGNSLLGVGGTGLLNTYWGLILPFVAHPFGVFLCRQSFLSFPAALDEAATIEGCSKFRIFWNIYVPLSVPTLVTLGLLKTVSTWNQYTWPLILTNTDRMKTVQLALSNFSTEYTTNWGYVMSATTLIILPVMALFLLLQKYYVSGIVTTGVKGVSQWKKRIFSLFVPTSTTRVFPAIGATLR